MTDYAKRRKELEKTIADADARKAAIDKEVAGARKELKAIDAALSAYDKVMKGTQAKRQTGVKQQILSLLKKPMKKADVVAALPDVKQTTISNTLASLKRAGQITRNEDGTYKVS